MDRRIPAKIGVRRRHRPSQSPSPSPSRSPIHLGLRKTAALPRQSPKSTAPDKNLLVIKRCKSEPILWRSGNAEDDDRRVKKPVVISEVVVEEEEVMFRPQTCSDIFMSEDYVVSSSPRKCYEGIPSINEDAKVVISVIVEGSPGPVRTLVKLSCNIEDAIRVVVHKYNSEGRTPPLKLNNNGDDDDLNFELHSSNFSLQGLNKSELIGNIGTRNFYLRKRNYNREAESTTVDSDTNSIDKDNTCLPVFTAFTFVPCLNIMSWKITFMRRTRKIWRVLGCVESSG